MVDNEKKFLQIYHNSPAIYILLDNNFKIIDCNKKFLEVLNLNLEDVINKNIENFILSSYIPKIKAFKEYLLYKGVASGEFAIVNTDKPEPIEVFLTATINTYNNTIFFIMQDITKYKWMHNSLIAYAEQLKKEMKKAENSNLLKTTFIANISHEMRTPLTSIIGFAELLKETLLDNNQKDFINTIIKSSKHLLEIINDVIEISKIEADKIDLEIDDIDINKIIEDVVNMLIVKANEKKLELNVSIDEKLKNLYIRTDGFRLKQILINLVSNAIKFTHQGYVKIDVKLTEKNIIIDVIDTGIGIEKEKLDIIFEPFVQGELKLSREYEGTGLGLAITKNLVKLMDGQIKVESEKGKGSKFSVIFPKNILTNREISYRDIYDFENKKIETEITEELQTENKKEEIKIEINTKDPIILVIEDNNAIIMLLDFIFKKNSIPYISVNTGMEGISYFKQYSHCLKLILTDISLNDISGIDVGKEIKKIDKNIKIIGFSAYSITDVEEKIKGVFDDYIKKPFTIDEILFKLKKYIGSEKDN
ncbi:MAG TPA: ATP-binding protein [Spirochaetota bacterium]|nr:ATP-binding protein [Spirochaetota bacterium]HPQ49819.1 ATP-binding protein [Spirochaetota bacterium]